MTSAPSTIVYLLLLLLGILLSPIVIAILHKQTLIVVIFALEMLRLKDTEEKKEKTTYEHFLVSFPPGNCSIIW